jgi:hypothetical protein
MIELACGDGRMRRGPYSPRAMSSPMIPALATNGLRFDDLFRADALAALDARFLAELASVAPETHARLVAYRACKGAGMEAEAVSEVLSESAPFLGDFVARLFGVANERRALMTDADQVTPIFRMQDQLVKRRAIKRGELTFDAAVDAEVRRAFATLGVDPESELSVARLACDLLDPSRARSACRSPAARSTRRSPRRTSSSSGDAIAALALIASTTPCMPGTGHRICNDCMKACIFQKQEPVNIPQIETGDPHGRARAAVGRSRSTASSRGGTRSTRAPFAAALQRQERARRGPRAGGLHARALPLERGLRRRRHRRPQDRAAAGQAPRRSRSSASPISATSSSTSARSSASAA